ASGGFAPLGFHVFRRLVEVPLLVDLADPVQRNEMMLAAGRIVPGELDLVGAVHVIDLRDLLAVGGDHIHVLLDRTCIPPSSSIASLCRMEKSNRMRIVPVAS